MRTSSLSGAPAAAGGVEVPRSFQVGSGPQPPVGPDVLAAGLQIGHRGGFDPGRLLAQLGQGGLPAKMHRWGPQKGG
jgi:hypothetical protein